MKPFDVIVVGGGHAGTEAAAAAARLGAKTVLITHKKDTIGQMSCNPAIGGIGKGHLVKEVDALGGIMARAIDVAGIQFRTLNASKGPAVRATRAQADRQLYGRAVRAFLMQQPNLTLIGAEVDRLCIVQDRITGVHLASGETVLASVVVLTVGTFLGGKMHIGLKQREGGRVGAPASMRLAADLRALPLRVGSLKTGTPPRLDGTTIDYSKLIAQPGDTPLPVFSYIGSPEEHPRQVACHLTHTNEQTHAIIRAAHAQSPLFTGVIQGVGPRYCPSIEDKVARFADKPSHQIFVEPEGLTTTVVYPNGISTSLPAPVQEKFVRSMLGFERARILEPGYAIEYDYFDPRDLRASLETIPIAGLFLAGQINGTTGYEEAAAQGLIAGLNAVLLARGEAAWTPRRDEAYLGVMIDDLITRGTEEPYRMFTSRAEYRLMLREDNADLRLTEQGRRLGLVDDHRWALFSARKKALADAEALFRATTVRPQSTASTCISSMTSKPLDKAYTVYDLLKRSDITYEQLAPIEALSITDVDALSAKQVEIGAKYAGYIARQQAEIRRHQHYDKMALPLGLDYQQVHGLSHEARQRLSETRPSTIGQAARIPGITPASISLLLVYLKKSRGQYEHIA